MAWTGSMLQELFLNRCHFPQHWSWNYLRRSPFFMYFNTWYIITHNYNPGRPRDDGGGAARDRGHGGGHRHLLQVADVQQGNKIHDNIIARMILRLVLGAGWRAPVGDLPLVHPPGPQPEQGARDQVPRRGRGHSRHRAQVPASTHSGPRLKH